MFATSPRLQKLVLDNACQFKNPTMEYMIEKNSTMRWLHLYAANLINNETWTKFFTERGYNLETLQLADLDTFFEDEHLQLIAEHCLRLSRLKVKRCRRLTPDCVETISRMRSLEHLSLQFSTGISVPNDLVTATIISLGPNLRTLSLQDFMDLDDAILETIAAHCSKMEKLRLSSNDTATDTAWAQFFANWQNPPLRFLDLSRTRDVDNANPDGPEDAPIGIGEHGFPALMQHSSSKLQYLHLASCRHIPYNSLITIFDGTQQYPELLEVDFSFVSNVDTLVLAGLFKSAPKLRKVVAFGCFAIEDVVVPQGVVVIGVPRAQDAIEQFGMAGMDVDGALGGMLTSAMEIDVAA
jgi:DNA repair protein RAD7